MMIYVMPQTKKHYWGNFFVYSALISKNYYKIKVKETKE